MSVVENFFDQVSGSRDLLAKGLLELIKPFDYARVCGRPYQEFALSLAAMHSIGFQENEIRFLFHLGLIKPLEEVERLGGNRNFNEAAELFGVHVCYMLTNKGVEFVQSLDHDLTALNVPIAKIKSNAAQIGFGGNRKVAAKPCWNGKTRMLTVADVTVKRYRVPAQNQALVLNAFEEEGWPVSILDPLPLSDGIDPKIRVRDTIKSLNNRHENRVIRFHGNGTGQGICWSWLTEDTEDADV